MKGIVTQSKNLLIWQYDDELIWIEPWGCDSLRVRITHLYKMPQQDWALLPVENQNATIVISQNQALKCFCIGSVNLSPTKDCSLI